MRLTYGRFGSGLFVLLSALSPLSGCGCDSGGGKSATDAGMDAGFDAAVDGFDGDIPLPVATPDSGIAKPGDPDDGLVGRCAIDTNKIFTAVVTDELLYGTPLAVDPVNAEFALPYVGASTACLDAVYLSTFSGANAAPPPAASAVVDECALASLPATTWAGEHWLIAMVDNRLGPNHLWVQAYNPVTKKAGTGQLISESNPESVAITTMRDGSVMIAWAEVALDGSGSVRVRPLDEDGKPRGDERIIEQWNASKGSDPVKNPKLVYRGLLFSTLGPDGAGLAYWRYGIGVEVSELVFAALDNVGKSARPLWVLTKSAGRYASIDVDVNKNGGGIVYTQTESVEGQHLWLQLIDDTGAPLPLLEALGTTPPIRILGGRTRAVDVSVAKLFRTYGVVYRELAPEPLPDAAVVEERAQIRLLFLNREGQDLGSSDLSFTSDTGGRTAIETAYDGRVVVSWTEIDDEGKSVIRIVRLPCTG